MKRKKTAQPLIGISVEVVAARNPSLVGIDGKVTDETRNTIKVLTQDGEKVLVKDQVTMKIEGKIVNGNDLMGRIEERIKKSR